MECGEWQPDRVGIRLDQGCGKCARINLMQVKNCKYEVQIFTEQNPRHDYLATSAVTTTYAVTEPSIHSSAYNDCSDQLDITITFLYSRLLTLQPPC